MGNEAAQCAGADPPVVFFGDAMSKGAHHRRGRAPVYAGLELSHDQWMIGHVGGGVQRLRDSEGMTQKAAPLSAAPPKTGPKDQDFHLFAPGSGPMTNFLDPCDVCHDCASGIPMKGMVHVEHQCVVFNGGMCMGRNDVCTHYIRVISPDVHYRWQ